MSFSACSRQRDVSPSVVPTALQASVRNEQLMSIGGEIALSGNIKLKNERKNEKMKNVKKRKGTPHSYPQLRRLRLTSFAKFQADFRAHRFYS